jgi:hypothetical protein
MIRTRPDLHWSGQDTYGLFSGHPLAVGSMERYPMHMSEPIPRTAEQEFSPEESAVLNALHESLRRGDVAAVARWQRIASELGLPASVVGVNPDPPPQRRRGRRRSAGPGS